MLRTRFLKPNEVVEAVIRMYSNDRRNVRMFLDQERITELAESYYKKVSTDTGSICAIFDDSESMVAIYMVVEYPDIAGWRVAGTKVLESSNHYAKTAKLLAPGIDAVIKRMESKGFYKWWMIAPEQHHNIRNKIMCKYSTMLGRYEWYDDLVIPSNSINTGVKNFDDYREVIDWSDTVARMFVLKQKHRVEIFQSKNFKDYKGTILDGEMVE